MTGKAQSPDKRRQVLLSRVTPGFGGCWIWTGHTMPTGYGLFALHGQKVYAHRASYELNVEHIPDGMHIDHLCRVRRCIRPDHLEAVSQAENNNRAAAARTKCRHGHELNGVRQNKGIWSRYCKTCHCADSRRRWASKGGKS